MDVLLVFLGFADLLAKLRLSRPAPAGADRDRLREWVTVYGGAGALTGLVARPADGGQLVLAGLAVAVTLALRRTRPQLHLTGYLALATTWQFRVAAVGWLVHFVVTADLDLLARGLVVAIAVVAAALLPVRLLDTLLVQDAACRRDWDTVDSVDTVDKHRPFVSIHVPCYAEPPDVVTATLDALARLAYDRYEVLVVDNNTQDEALWRPVAEHCRRLGSRFRFFHVAPLAGAKAGALNFALARTRADAELVAVVDADYQAEPGFLAELVGAFAEPRLGFLQTSHDYRDWTHSFYLTGCYWEYRAMYGGYMRSRSRRVAALTTGTMCLVRRRALAQVGGWAQWCVTEDSELAVRLHAAGYPGRYVHRTYGRGLVPAEFAGYKQQRFRWIYGPTQEFRRHWRLFLPARWAVPSALTPRQKLLFAHHGVRELVVAGASVVTTAAVVALTVALATGLTTAPVLPAAALIGLAAGTASGMLDLWPVFRRVLGCSRARAWHAIACRLALFDTRLAAGIAGWRSTSGTFRRTNKFPAQANWSRALASTSREATRGVAALALAGWGLAATAGASLMLPLAGYLIVRALGWLAAPALALTASRCLAPGSGSSAPVPTAGVAVPTGSSAQATSGRSGST